MQPRFWSQLSLFAVTFIAILMLREFSTHLLLQNGIHDYQIHTAVDIAANVLLVLISIILINQNGLRSIAGLGNVKTEKWYLLLFPLFYLVGLNLLITDAPSSQATMASIAIFLVNCLSIGFAEELTIRGFLQSFLIKHFGKTKKGVLSAVVLASVFFGLVHLIKFDNGLYGEMAQLAFASFIGLMFGIVLVLTKRIYPLIIIHAVVDLFADLGEVGMPIQEKLNEAGSLENALLIILLTSPCLIYALVLMVRYKQEEQQEKQLENSSAAQMS
ncbi:CPBP family intramembrane glutamic endopeptidase [uncultured Pseudoteredinibacter sp.]|uniref:CPBP family intramembrane glutamic endopeptidase n=1 Tax=uncultured Pseudoteredinibacter sp. TaxID=1641701 RepID=UPI0026234C22|nr:CPBP family intramembrane glutamic endopeptidase [uncultured Pseudoteredinibacter sp.]